MTLNVIKAKKIVVTIDLEDGQCVNGRVGSRSKALNHNQYLWQQTGDNVDNFSIYKIFFLYKIKIS